MTTFDRKSFNDGITAVVRAAVVFGVIWCIAMLFMLSVFMVLRATAHNAPTGWAYDSDCCSSIDCAPAPSDSVRELPQGVLVVPTGEVIPYGDSRLRDAPDGLVHLCRSLVDPKRTYCVYLPSKGS